MTLADVKRKIMDYVARRDHTEKELRQKLSIRFEKKLIDEALLWAHQQNWLASPEKLTEQMSEQLHRRKKGIRRINQKLQALGLNQISSDTNIELKKAQELIRAKWTAEDFIGLGYADAQKLKAKMMRFLMTRGFESHVISQILKTEFNKGAPSYDEEF